MRFLVDSNYGERDTSFSPSRVFALENGSYAYVRSSDRDQADGTDEGAVREGTASLYGSLEEMAAERSFVAKWMAAQN